MARVIIGDLLTGRRLLDVPFTSYTWNRRRNRPETMSVTVPVNATEVRQLNLRNVSSPGKTMLAIVEEVEGGEWFAGAGPAGKPSYSRDEGTYVLPGSGIRRYMQDRAVLPAAAYTADVTTFVIPDPLDTTKTIPNPALATAYTSVSYGTMVKKLIQQMLAAPAGNLPIVLPADVAGAHDKRWDAIDFKSVDGAITDIINLEGGPDIDLEGRYQTDRRGVEWLLRTGSDIQPILSSTSVHRWDLTAANSFTRGLKVDWDPDDIGSVSWATGGRSTDLAIVERASSSLLTAAGYPLRDIVDTSHTDVSLRSTLQAYAANNLNHGQSVTEAWTFEVQKDKPPYLGQYRVGDYCDLLVRGDPIIPDSTGRGYRRQIVAMSGNQTNWVTVTTVEA